MLVFVTYLQMWLFNKGTLPYCIVY